MNKSKITSFPALLAIMLKEFRLERGLHQAELAEACGKTASAWTKIERSKAPLTMEILFLVCQNQKMRISPSFLMAAAERHSLLLRQNGWKVVGTLERDDDDLLKLVDEYYGSAGFKNRNYALTMNSILHGPMYYSDNTVQAAPVFHFVLDTKFKQASVNGDSYPMFSILLYPPIPFK